MSMIDWCLTPTLSVSQLYRGVMSMTIFILVVPWNIKFICTRLKIEWTALQRFECSLVFKARTNTFYICPQCTYMYIVYVDVFTRINIVILITPRYNWDTDNVGVKHQSIILIVMYLKYTIHVRTLWANIKCICTSFKNKATFEPLAEVIWSCSINDWGHMKLLHKWLRSYEAAP
jgi:hypothetical protein